VRRRRAAVSYVIAVVLTTVVTAIAIALIWGWLGGWMPTALRSMSLSAKAEDVSIIDRGARGTDIISFNLKNHSKYSISEVEIYIDGSSAASVTVSVPPGGSKYVTTTLGIDVTRGSAVYLEIVVHFNTTPESTIKAFSGYVEVS